MMDNRGETFYQVIIHKLPCIQFEIRTMEGSIYFEVAPNITLAKRRAKEYLTELGVIFKREIRFKKHETKRKKLYQSTRRK